MSEPVSESAKELQGEPGGESQEARARPAVARSGHNYQDFEGSGKTASKSHKKLKALRLSRLPGAGERAQPLEGLSLLDLGCNEGFFCLEAVKQGARRVVGIDSHKKRIEAARQNCPEGTFFATSWWDLPDERFDVILMLSAMHYEAQPKRLFAKIRDHLAPGGTFILECGIAGNSSNRAWKSVRRTDGVRKYPTLGLLTDILLQGYAVRHVGPSVNQGGDPIPRSVLHCTPLASTAVLVGADGGAGKSTLTRQLFNAGWPGIATDGLFTRLLKDRDYAWRPLAKRVVELVGDGKPSWRRVGKVIAEEEAMLTEFCDLLVLEAPTEADFFYIEGEMLSRPKVREDISRRLREQGVRTWIVQPGP